jgi:hypothetical protein
MYNKKDCYYYYKQIGYKLYKFIGAFVVLMHFLNKENICLPYVKN